jgi:hypothetical protein
MPASRFGLDPGDAAMGPKPAAAGHLIRINAAAWAAGDHAKKVKG